MAGIEKKLMDKWIVKSSENLIDNNWVKVRRDDVELPNGEEIKDFYVVSLNEAVAIVAVDGNDNLILTKQYRHSYNKELIEIPAGVPFPVSWTVKMKKKQKETQDILSYHSQAAGCSDKARAKASGGRQPIEECGRTGL